MWLILELHTGREVKDDGNCPVKISQNVLAICNFGIEFTYLLRVWMFNSLF